MSKKLYIPVTWILSTILDQGIFKQMVLIVHVHTNPQYQI